MNTITIEKTAPQAAEVSSKTFILSKEQYLTIQAHWKAQKTHPAWAHVGYNLIRGKDPMRGFTRLTDRKVSSRGGDPWNGYNSACATLHAMLEPFIARVGESQGNVKYKTEQAAIRASNFKKVFGIDLTDEVRLAFPKLEKKHD